MINRRVLFMKFKKNALLAIMLGISMLGFPTLTVETTYIQ